MPPSRRRGDTACQGQPRGGSLFPGRAILIRRQNSGPFNPDITLGKLQTIFGLCKSCCFFLVTMPPSRRRGDTACQGQPRGGSLFPGRAILIRRQNSGPFNPDITLGKLQTIFGLCKSCCFFLVTMPPSRRRGDTACQGQPRGEDVGV
ncbi:hypothetical protein BDB01DRAFT_897871 [Pilobolus umbonatus]|nr:hypothetical protein BDB01DRAFT_897871 [Pilobolus umbonatus]